jgi:hypothetical protein
LQRRHDWLRAGGPRIEADEDVARQRIGLYRVHPGHLAQPDLELVPIPVGPARYMEAHSPGDHAQDADVLNRRTHGRSPSPAHFFGHDASENLAGFGLKAERIGEESRMVFLAQR